MGSIQFFNLFVFSKYSSYVLPTIYDNKNNKLSVLLLESSSTGRGVILVHNLESNTNFPKPRNNGVFYFSVEIIFYGHCPPT